MGIWDWHPMPAVDNNKFTGTATGTSKQSSAQGNLLLSSLPHHRSCKETSNNLGEYLDSGKWTFDMRLDLATHVAQKLAYVPEIHGDIKPRNTVAFDDFGSKVLGDLYKVAYLKLLPQTKPYNEFNSFLGNDITILGSPGYIDPEYKQSDTITKKSNVYSYGVVLAELLTGQKAWCDEFEGEERNLAHRFLKKLRDGHLIDILDQQMVVNKGKETMERVMKVAKLAERCLEMKGEDRPTMMEVFKELQEIRGF